MIEGHVLALCGGVGGAKLAAGLAEVLAPDQLTIVVNTGDDFEHLGLSICPDIDTVLYTLSGLNDEQRGWGLADESWQALAMLKRFDEPSWFQLGDRDLATHITRTHHLRAGESLSAVTARLSRALGIGPAIIPMSDDLVRTEIETVDGEVLEFQRYFVALQCKPVARAVRYAGAGAARASALFEEALKREDLAGVIICPSNPYLSIDPLLALPGVRQQLAALRTPRIAVSPIVAGKAIKGPLAKLMSELGATVSPTGIARHYRGLIDALVIDDADAGDVGAVGAEGVRAVTAQSVMKSRADRAGLARAVLASLGAN